MKIPFTSISADFNLKLKPIIELKFNLLKDQKIVIQMKFSFEWRGW